MTSFKLLLFFESRPDTSPLPWQLVCFIAFGILVYVAVLAIFIGRRRRAEKSPSTEPQEGEHVGRGDSPPARDEATADVGEGIRVLIVEELTTHRRVLLSQVIALGQVRCTITSDGDEALEALRDADYDVIFADCTESVAASVGLIQCIRRLEDFGARRTYIVALTNSAGDRQHHRCLRAGADEVFPKPMDAHQFSSAICRAVEAMPVKMSADLAMASALSEASQWTMSMKLRQSLDDDVDRVRQGIEHSDRTIAIQASHRIAGASRWLRLTEIADAATQLEEDLSHPKCPYASLHALEEALKGLSHR
jgi:CheY-like chemotaxis protein